MKLRRPLLAALLVFLAAPLARATWTIVAVDLETREVGIAGATCIGTPALDALIAVVRPGEGVAAAQSFVDVSGANRMLIWEDLALGVSPAKILRHLEATDSGHQTRQYGIVSLAAPPVTFTGTGAGNAHAGVTGSIGSVRYAIQGNLLTGAVVVDAAEAAFLATDGDLSQRLMAAMAAARDLGGDGRCSCGPNTPTQCGAPPPEFEQSCQSSFVIVARVGDQPGSCGAGGCSNGTYWLRLREAAGAPTGLDPVDLLEEAYVAWRAAKQDQPDAVHTELLADRQRLVADGRSRATVVVKPADIDGTPITRPGLVVRVRPREGGELVRAGAVKDRGDGTYVFEVRAGERAGTAALRVVVRDGPHRAVLPDLVFKLVPEPSEPGF